MSCCFDCHKFAPPGYSSTHEIQADSKKIAIAVDNRSMQVKEQKTPLRRIKMLPKGSRLY